MIKIQLYLVPGGCNSPTHRSGAQKRCPAQYYPCLLHTIPYCRYEEIQELQTNKEKRSVRDLFEAANEACIIDHFLAKYSDFFSKTQISSERLKELLFHHYFNTTLNKMAVEKTKKNSIDTEFHEVAEAIYAFSSLLNHHCYGNVTAVFYGGTLVLKAARNIKSGESCTLTYR